MNILAINFGHDASLCLFDKGRLISFRELERYTRLKHNVGVSVSDLHHFLADANLCLQDIELVGICGTQYYKAKHDGAIHLTAGHSDVFGGIECDSAWHKETSIGGTDNWYSYATHSHRLLGLVQTPLPLDLISDGMRQSPSSEEDWCELDRYLENLLEVDSSGIREVRAQCRKYLYPYVFQVGNVSIPAFFVPHQQCHASYASRYLTDLKPGLIVSHDGGWPHIPFNCSGIFLKGSRSTYPLIDPKMFLGQLYQRAGEMAGFRPSEAPGKLMGLASYGVVTESIARMQEELYEYSVSKSRVGVLEFEQILYRIMKAITRHAKNVLVRPEIETFDCNFADVQRSVGIAAVTQKLVEASWVEIIAPIILRLTATKDLQRTIPIVGGFSLNCPSNTKLQTECPGSRVSPFPAGSDMGTSIGAGVFLSELFDEKFSEEGLNPAFPRALSKDSGPLGFEDDLLEICIEGRTEDWYVERLLDGNIICHFDGNSEVGPRALGHRSIIAHATSEALRDRINRQKNRESWRPLAPICRSEDFGKFFSGSQSSAAYMLFTCPVLDMELTGVTHVDGTSRVQTVSSGFLYDVLAKIDERGSIPVLINTSFNIAGEPLVETRQQAVTSFLELGFDYLYIEGRVFCPNDKRRKSVDAQNKLSMSQQ